MNFTLPDLPYAYDALEPHLDARTMEIHHTKHHRAYVDGLNRAVADCDLHFHDVEEMLSNLHDLPESIRTTVRNHGGGHANHSLFWSIMSPHGGGRPEGDLAVVLDNELGGYEFFRRRFTEAALARFGSGWVWLCVDANRKVRIESTANQDSPWIYGERPILGIDLWEHAYYLKFQNRRADYIEALFEVIDWQKVDHRYIEAVRETSMAHSG